MIGLVVRNLSAAAPAVTVAKSWPWFLVLLCCRWAGTSTKTGLIAMCFMGAFGFVVEDKMHACRMKEGYKRVGADE